MAITGLILFLAVEEVSAFYSSSTGKWLSRDPLTTAEPEPSVTASALQMAMEGQAQPYGFNKNDGINHVDVLGLMRIQDLLARIEARRKANANVKCCCDSPNISAGIQGICQGGSSVLAFYSDDFIDVFWNSPCIFDPEVYWWDCYSASAEAGSWPFYRGSWSDYGWSGPGAYNYQVIATPNLPSFRDPYHLAVLSMYVWDACEHGRRVTKVGATNGLLWTWDKTTQTWTGPGQITQGGGH